MQDDRLIRQILEAWQRNNQINLLLIGAIPRKGFAAVPSGSRGRTVAEQLEHMKNVRLGWLRVHATGRRPRRARAGKKGAGPSRAELQRVFVASAAAVEEFLGRALRGQARPRMFGGNPVRWMGYLISHESHHRGQIALALKQNGMRLPESVAIQGLWGRWMMGR